MLAWSRFGRGLDLYDRDELLGMLEKYGGFDSTLDKVRDAYTERFGNQLIWKYPFSDNMQGGGVIVPVQETMWMILAPSS